MANERADYQLSVRIGAELNVLSDMSPNRGIYKVHEHLRKVNKDAYEPRVLAIGPYHWEKDHLKMMEEHKKRYLKMLLQRRGENDLLRYVRAMRGWETEARTCYASDFENIGTDEFVRMMLLDSCFIVELLRKQAKKSLIDNNDIIFQMDWIAATIIRDLLLVENQLPFFLLWEFFHLTSMSNDDDSIGLLIYMLFSRVLPKGNKPKQLTLDEEDSRNIKHLVALLHEDWRPSPTRDGQSPSSESKKKWEFIPCATELKEAGIKFKKRDGKSFIMKQKETFKKLLGMKFEETQEKTYNLFEIKFKNGVIRIPRLEIEDKTETLLRNLIAYEQFFFRRSSNYVTDYARFMDCLINSSKDVELLRQQGIIHNCLGDDEVIANMFNRLCDSVILSSKDFYYSELFNKVNEHCSRGWNKKMANLRHNYFNTPWAFISFLAALLLLLLTAAQTVLSGLSLHK